MICSGLLLLAVASLLAVGCSDDADTSTTAVPSPPMGSKDLSPPVTDPRDVRGFEGRPCEILTRPQLTDLGVADNPVVEPGAGISPGTRTCEWRGGGANVPATVGVVFDATRDILGQHVRAFSGDPVFEHIQVDGLPAVRDQSIVGGASCTVVVGIAAQQGLSVDYSDTTEPYDDPCGFAERAAAAAVSNLPPLT